MSINFDPMQRTSMPIPFKTAAIPQDRIWVCSPPGAVVNLKQNSPTRNEHPYHYQQQGENIKLRNSLDIKYKRTPTQIYLQSRNLTEVKPFCSSSPSRSANSSPEYGAFRSIYSKSVHDIRLSSCDRAGTWYADYSLLPGRRRL